VDLVTFVLVGGLVTVLLVVRLVVGRAVLVVRLLDIGVVRLLLIDVVRLLLIDALRVDVLVVFRLLFV
jgi:hypothetical protein